MSKLAGYVQWVGGPKVHKGRDTWSFRIQDVEKWFNTEFNPNLKRMDNIEFEYTEDKGRNVVVPGSVRPVNLGTLPMGSGVPKSGSVDVQRVLTGRDDYWTSREQRDIANEQHRKENELRIQYQSARNAAISVVDILVSSGSLIIPEKKGAGSEVILAKIEDLTNEFYEKVQSLDTGGVGSVQDVPVDDDSSIPH